MDTRSLVPSNDIRCPSCRQIDYAMSQPPNFHGWSTESTAHNASEGLSRIFIGRRYSGDMLYMQTQNPIDIDLSRISDGEVFP